MTAVKTWAADQAEEDAMNDDHRHLWAQMVAHMEERYIPSAHVLDYGCNQGGFLRLLHGMKPFARGTGADIATESLAVAAQNARGLPLDFITVDALGQKVGAFDIAFSHEVLYLLPDLAAHAALMARVLKPGGVYYAAIGCHTGNPQWDHWRTMIAEYSNVPVQDYSLDDYADAFFDAGFSVTAMPFRFEGFVPLKKNNPYFPSVSDSLAYYNTHKTLFRLVRSAK